MKPLISVIVPVYNDPEGLNDTLTSLINQEFDRDSYEVLIVDNGSGDRTLSVANKFRTEYPGLIKVLIEDKIQSSYAARNRGIISSTGEIIAFIDADMTVEPDWLSKIIDTMSGNDIKYAGCNVEMVLKHRSVAGLYDLVTGFKIPESLKLKHFASTNSLLIRREIFNALGLFDCRLVSGGDREFGIRSWNANYKQLFAENIKIIHPVKNNIRDLYNRFFRLGRGIFQLQNYYPELYKSYREKISSKYIIPEKPFAYIKKMLLKKKVYKFSYLHILFFYFIKWILKIAKYRGYLYEKKNKT
jgi:glycosyltransferase AglI